MLVGMSTTTTITPTREAPITSIQPGGGFCFGLEQTWGHCRRALLRRFFPGYVQRMLSLRRGACPDCSHDIIDSRDLKLVRNVCGYRFEANDDPFAWRDRLGLARAGLAELLLATVVLLPTLAALIALAWGVHPAWGVPAGVIAIFWIFILSFFRDPDRVVPTAAEALVSPADGVVTHLEEVDEPGLGRVFRVSIFLSVFNVHVNRTPRRATVTRLAYYPGEFLDARATGCAVRNEQLWIDFRDDQLGVPLRVKQIAGAIARRIVCWVRPGEQLAAGERFGMIKFGSRTDVLVPLSQVASIAVKVGQSVRGGADVLLRLKSSQEAPQ